MRTLFASAVLLSSLVAGCGAKVAFVLDDDGDGGSSPGNGGNGGNGGIAVPGVTSTDATSTATSTSTSTGGMSSGGGGPGLVEEVVVEGFEGFVSLDAQPGTLGITAIATSNNTSAQISFDQLAAPSGSVVVSGFLPSNEFQWSWFGALAHATPQVDHPETFPLANGAWSFHFQSDSDTRVGLWRRSTVDGAFHGGVLDVNVFAPAGLLSEAATIGSLAVAFNDWAGIELGNVSFYTVDDQYFVVDDDNVFSLLEETSAAETRPALNVMATASIEGSFSGAAGFAVGIPGVGMWHGTHASAIVWMVSGQDFDPLILRHEAGHFAGLFHTSEFSPGLGDPLDDTPLCPDVETMLGDCPDIPYTMFPTGGTGQGLFSPKEKIVIQGGTLYRGVYAAGEQPMTPYGPPLDGPGSDAREGAGRRASDAEIAAAKARTRDHAPPALVDEAWADALPRAAALSLAGIGCATGQLHGYFDELAGLGIEGAAGVAQMAALAADDSAPLFVRRRAIAMLGRLLEDAPDAALTFELETLARDGDAPGLLRGAALRALARASRADAESLAFDLADDGDVFVARAVATLR
jgi:hypothetical protein